MVQAWRIVPERRAETAFDGEGARLYGGRWNSAGRAAVYLAASRALAALEVLVHLHELAATQKYVLFEVNLPPQYVLRPKLDNVIPYLTSPIVHPETQLFGDNWLEAARQPALQVCSAIIPEEAVYLLNPLQADFRHLGIGPARPFSFDPRLIEGH